ncbi:MAG: zinc ribbon domain-containing protein, partial [Clostridiales bacterium]|nr:zinc ribbon domain-containing protein [Clostridiales bacterium]
FNMYGGEIKDCSSSNSGGGVHIGSGGTFNMYGGDIHDNITEANYGGAGVCIYDNSGVFHMYGGTIRDNVVNAKSKFFVSNNGTVVYTKKVTEETLKLFYQGAGVRATAGTFTLEGDVVITGNYRISDFGDNVSNVEVRGGDGTKIEITGTLGNNSDIGITAPNGAFTSGYTSAGNTQKPSEFFSSDNVDLKVAYDELREEAAITDDDGEYVLLGAEIAGTPTTTVGDTEITFSLNVTLRNTLDQSTKTVPAVVKVELDSPLLGGSKTVSFVYKYNGVNGEQTADLSCTVVPNKFNTTVTWTCSGASSYGSGSATRDYDGNDILSSITASYTGYDGELKTVVGSWTANDITVTDGDGNSVASAVEAGVYKFRLAASADYEFNNDEFTVTVVGSAEEGYYKLHDATVIGVKGTPVAGDKTVTVIIQRTLKHTQDQPDKTDSVDYVVTLTAALHGGENTVEFEYKYTDMGGDVQTKSLSATVTAAKKNVTVAWYFYDSLVAGTAQHVYDGVDVSDKIVAVYDGTDGTKQRVDGSSALMLKTDEGGNTVSSLSGAGVYTLCLAESADYVFANNSFTYTVVEDLGDITDLVYEESGKTVMGVSCDGGFEVGTELVVEKTSCDPDVVDGEISTALDVRFVKDSAEITPTGSVKVHVLIPDELRNGKAYKIYNLKNGVATELQYTTEGNYAIFDADELDCILFVTPKNAPPVENPTEDPDGETDLTWLWILLGILAVLIVVAIIVIVVLKRRKEPAQNHANVCPSCGKQNGEGATFCGYCGHKFEVKREDETAVDEEKNDTAEQAHVKVCPDCGRQNDENAMFCGKCGHKFE